MSVRVSVCPLCLCLPSVQLTSETNKLKEAQKLISEAVSKVQVGDPFASGSLPSLFLSVINMIDRYCLDIEKPNLQPETQSTHPPSQV